jgi:hypothetical protein
MRHHNFHHNIRRKNKKWPIIVIITILLALLIFVRVPVAKFPFNSGDTVICVNNELKLKNSGNLMDPIAKSTAELAEASAGLRCVIEAYPDEFATSQIECINNIPIVICKSKLYKAIFRILK